MATLTADQQGKIKGKFTIPANVPAGSKPVIFMGQGGSRADATFYGQGNLTTTVMKRYAPPVDPLAQSFMPDRNVMLAGVDLWFTAKESEVRIQIRPVQSGVPGREVLAEASIQPDQIVVSGGGHTRIQFESPVSLEANGEYALVIMCDDPKTRVALAQMGKFDQNRQQWVTQQPYAIGVLLSSSNASSWTPHQDMDLAFRLLEADYGDSQDTVLDLGQAEVSECTDLILSSVSEVPTSQCRLEYELTLPDGTKQTIAAEQALSFGQSISGTIGVKARLVGTPSASPTLLPDTRLLAGTTGLTADYCTRSIPATNANKVTLIYEANIPSGAAVTPQIKVDAGEWEEIPAQGATPGDDGKVEYRFSKAISGASLVKAKIVLSGSLAARPTVSKIRLLATA